MPATSFNAAAQFLPAQSTADDLLALIEPLSPHERGVLHLLTDGLSNREIAQQLVSANSSVKRHTINIYGKQYLWQAGRQQPYQGRRSHACLFSSRHLHKEICDK